MQASANNPEAGWTQLARDWNRAHPEEPYSDWRDLRNTVASLVERAAGGRGQTEPILNGPGNRAKRSGL